VDTPFAAKTDAAGRAVVHDLPPGSAAVTVWHPHLKAPRNEITLQAAAGQSLAVKANLRVPVARRGGY